MGERRLRFTVNPLLPVLFNEQATIIVDRIARRNRTRTLVEDDLAAPIVATDLEGRVVSKDKG